MAVPDGPKTDAQWKAENDARSLIDAEAIKLDKSRLTRAKVAAKRLAVEKTKEATAAKKVSRSAGKATRKAQGRASGRVGRKR